MALSPTEEKVCFGLFELDLKAAQLTKNGSSIRLPQQPLRLLSILIESAGQIVTREQLRQRLWTSDVFIDFDHGLNKSMQKLRDALGDSAGSPRYIETVPRVGYRFIAPVRGTRPDLDAASQSPENTPSHALTLPAGKNATTRWLLAAAGLLAIVAAAGIAFYFSFRTRPAVPTYTQLTDFTDSASAPALSPDGHMLAFIRGGNPFVSTGQIYAKMLPDGEVKLLTNDVRPKYNLAFSPDGSQIAYTVMEQPAFAAYTVSALGGDPHLLLKNAAALAWLDPQHYLYSRIRSGLHMGIVTQSTTGDGFRELYYPAHERSMAHYSFASPDRTHALVVEMDGQGQWTLCQLISLEGTPSHRPVGPQGACTAASWSPDGSWMYFIVTVHGHSHLWRQRYPDGSPEQITQGPSEEEGLAVEQDGRSIISSIGEDQSSIWIRDAAGQRALSSEGEIVAPESSPPSFAAGDRILYYLLRRQAGDSPELWRVTLDTGKAESVFPGIPMYEYDLSPDGKQVVYTTRGGDGRFGLWLAQIDRSSPARQIGHSGEVSPHFGRGGKILFQVTEGNVNYLEQMNQDGSGRSKVVAYPIIETQTISPGRRWLTAIVPSPGGAGVAPGVVLIPVDGGPSRQICAGYCAPVWSSNGRFLIVPVEASSKTSPGRSLAVPLGPGETVPQLPPGGIPPLAAPGVVPGSQSINRDQLVPGKDLLHYAYVDTTVHRNLYRISLP